MKPNFVFINHEMMAAPKIHGTYNRRLHETFDGDKNAYAMFLRTRQMFAHDRVNTTVAYGPLIMGKGLKRIVSPFYEQHITNR